MNEQIILMTTTVTDPETVEEVLKNLPAGSKQPVVLDFRHTQEASYEGCDSLVRVAVSTVDGTVVIRNCWEKINELIKASARNRRVFHRFKFGY